MTCFSLNVASSFLHFCSSLLLSHPASWTMGLWDAGLWLFQGPVPLCHLAFTTKHHHPIVIIILIIIANQTQNALTVLCLTLSIRMLPDPPEPPRNLKVVNATTTTLTAKWEHAPGPVREYRITYRPLAGGDTLTVSPFFKKNCTRQGFSTKTKTNQCPNPLSRLISGFWYIGWKSGSECKWQISKVTAKQSR